MNNPRLKHVFAAFDALNATDPYHSEYQGKQYGKEYLYSQHMHARLEQFCPSASEALSIAAYSQHIQRWKILRTDYPEGRAGYKRWRTDLAKFHANTAAGVLIDLDYDADTIERVKSLLQKQGLKRDPETQTLEDVICLVFLEHYLEDFAVKHEEEKLIVIIQKTWKKMSEDGHNAALALPLAEPMLDIIKKALSE